VKDTRNCTLIHPLRTVFIDRDGVLNEKLREGCYVTDWSDFRLLPGVIDAIGLLNRARLSVLVVSNQRGIARGLCTTSDVEAIHTSFQRLLANHGAHVDGFYLCPHDMGQCNCRKPLPGLFERAVVSFPTITGETSAMIGDSYSDIEFGRRLGMLTVFIEGNPEVQKPGGKEARELANLHFSSLIEAVHALLEGLPPAQPSA
jgi:D-glycero-D-manno-heptose 1,7-bisphosphate phosphatase